MKNYKTQTDYFTEGLFSKINPKQEIKEPAWDQLSFEIPSVIQASPCTWMVTDLLKNQWGWISENAESLFGVNPKQLMNPGPNWFMPMIPSSYQKETKSAIESIWTQLINHYKIENHLCKYNLCFPITLPNGQEKEIFQQNAFYLPNLYQGNYLISIYSDITSIQVKKLIHATLILESDFQNIHPITCPSNQLHFSKRELEISQLLKKGHSSKCIADLLHISFHTVNKHRQNMMEKSGAKNTAELVTMVE